MKEQKELMQKLLDNANIPALSFSWCQNDTRYAAAYGKTDTLSLTPVDTSTLFQAASLSKPVSAAIVLDLVAQGKWYLDTSLAVIAGKAGYGPPELKKDMHYKILTTRMIIGQCSGLANFGQDGEDGKKFIATPNTRFTYSGVALDFLMQVIENKTGRTWEEIAQDFFKRAGMNSSTFLRQLPDGNLNGTHRYIAKAHMAAPSPNGPFVPLPPLPADVPGIAAGSMLTTAEDYITFLQYCFKNDYLKSTLLTGTLSALPPTTSPETSQVQWGLGMGAYNDRGPKTEKPKTIAFHWGNNTGSISFCAMDMATGNCVVSFANSMNGPSVFQKLAEPIVGDITHLFQWLSQYCGFKDVNPPQAPDAIAITIGSIHSLAKEKHVESEIEPTQRHRSTLEEIKQGARTVSTGGDDVVEKHQAPSPSGRDHE